jgi:phage host-nuclease inhibitor protein Gam
MPRVKPTSTAPLLKNLDDVDEALAEIAGHKRVLGSIEASMNDEIDEIKRRAASEAEPIRQEIARMEDAVTRYAAYHKPELFAKKKSLDLTFGVIGYRASSKLRLLSKVTWEAVLQNLRDFDLREFIRVKEEPDKEALKGLPPERLKELGCKVVQEDTFFYELSEQALAPETGEAA